MLIDWYTVAAQIINFLILIFLLKHFLYGRIIAAMDRREKRIADRLREAEEEKAEAQEQAAAYRAKTEDLDRRRSEMMADAEKKVDARRSELERRAEAEVEQARDSWYEAIEHERDVFLRTVREKSISELTSLARKVLSDLAGADLQEQIVRSFVSRLQKLDREQLDRIAAASVDGRVTIRSAFSLEERERSMLQDALARMLGNVSPDYVTNGDIGLGIIMEVPGLKIGWTVEDYMNDFEQALAQASERETGRRKSASGQGQRSQEQPEEKDASGGSEADGRRSQ